MCFGRQLLAKANNHVTKLCSSRVCDNNLDTMSRVSESTYQFEGSPGVWRGISGRAGKIGIISFSPLALLLWAWGPTFHQARVNVLRYPCAFLEDVQRCSVFF